MTTPDERMRALSWARELLAQLALDELVTEETRRVASNLRSQFPSTEQLASLISEDGSISTLPVGWATVIEAAGRLFREIQLGDGGSEMARNNILYTLRHFPLPGSATYFAKHGHLRINGPWIA